MVGDVVRAAAGAFSDRKLTADGLSGAPEWLTQCH